MTDLAMDFTTNDLLITNGDLSLATGETSIQQDIQQTIQLWLGEWFLDTTVGVPYRQQILVKNPNMDVVQADLTAAVADVPGVVQILSINFDYDSTGRSLSVSIQVQTTNGQTVVANAAINQPTNGTIEGTPY